MTEAQIDAILAPVLIGFALPVAVLVFLGYIFDAPKGKGKGK